MQQSTPSTAASDDPGTPAIETEAWTVSDGHAGNRRQAQALARALALPSTDWALTARAPWRWLAPRRLPGVQQAFGDGFAQALARPPRLAIGCGRQGALATRLLRERGARSIQILDPRLDPRHWDLVVAPEHDGLHGHNVVTLLGSLHPVDDDWLATARAQFAAFAALPSPRTALLIGGTSAHARFDEASFDTLLAHVRQYAQAHGGSVLATTSRRTPANVAIGLREQLRDLPGVIWSGEADGANPYAGLLAWADRIVCTADSVNMLSEAAATHSPLFIAGADRVDGRPRRFVDSLLGLERAQVFGGGMASPYAVTPLRETARVAGEVRRRLGL